jgi:hypothetical protein
MVIFVPSNMKENEDQQERDVLNELIPNTSAVELN